MTRQRTEITLPDDVKQDINDRKKKYGFNLSDYTERSYRKDYMSIEAKQDMILKKKKEILMLEEELKVARTLIGNLTETLTEVDKRKLLDGAKRIKKGFDRTSIWREVNVTLKKNWTFDEFNVLIKDVTEEKAVLRMAEREYCKKRKKKDGPNWAKKDVAERKRK